MSEAIDPLWIDVHSFSRTLLDLVERAGPTTPLEGALRQLAEAVLVQSEDEVVLSPSGDVGAPFLLRYVARTLDRSGPIKIVINDRVVVDVADARGHWLVSPTLLVPGLVIDAHNVRLFGRTVSASEAVNAYDRYRDAPVVAEARPVTGDALCGKCGFLREDDGHCYRCDAPKEGTLWAPRTTQGNTIATRTPSRTNRCLSCLGETASRGRSCARGRPCAASAERTRRSWPRRRRAPTRWTTTRERAANPRCDAPKEGT